MKVSVSVSKELIDYYAPLTAVAPGKKIEVLSSNDFLGMMSLGSDGGLYLFCGGTGGSRTAPFKRVKIEDSVKTFAAMRLKGSKTFVFAYIKNDSVYLCATDSPDHLTKAQFHPVTLALSGCEDCQPEALNITGLDGGRPYLSVAMKDPGGRISRITVDCTSQMASLFSIAANFTRIKSEILGRSIKEGVDGIYTLGEYDGKGELLYTPLLNVFGDTPPAPKRLLLPAGGGDVLSVCPLKNRIGTHLFVAGGGGIAYYPYFMQYDCAHAENPDPIVIESENTHIASVTAISSFINDGRLYVYVLSSSGQIYYAFAGYDEQEDVAGTFSELLLLRENCLYFRASEGRMFICEKNRLLFGGRDPESGAYRFKEAHFDADTGQFTSFRGVLTKIVTDKPEMAITLKAGNPIDAYINGSYIRFSSLTVKSDRACMLDIVQYADSLTIEPFTVQACGVSTDVDPSSVYHGRLQELSTAEGIKNAKIKTPGGPVFPLLPAGADEGTLASAAAAIAEMVNAPVLRPVFRVLPASLEPTNGGIVGYPHTPCLAQMGAFGAPAVMGMESNGVSGGLLYFLDDIFNSLYKIGKKFVSFVAKVVKDTVEFVINIGKKVIKFVLDTAWKVLEAIAKVLSYIGIPLDKLLDFLKYTFDIKEIVQESDRLKQMLRESISNAKPSVRQAQAKADHALDKAVEAVSAWANIPIPEEAGKKPDNTPQPTAQNMFLFDIIWRRFDILSVFDAVIPVAPSTELRSSAKRFYDAVSAESAAGILQAPINGIFEWAAGQNSNVPISTMMDSLKAVAGMITIPIIQLSRRIMDAVFDLFLNLLDFIAEAMDVKFHIPVLSDILNLLGIADFSMLDLIMLPAAFFLRIILYFTGEKSLMRTLSEAAEPEAKPRLPDKDAKNAVLAIQIVLFVVETAETVYTAVISLCKKPAKWAKDHYTISNLLGLLLTAADFGLCFGSGCYYTPMDTESFKPAQIYNILWYIKSGLAAAISIAGMFNEAKSVPLRKIVLIILNVIYCAAAIISFIFECIAIDNARTKQCPPDSDKPDFEHDKTLFILQTSSYLVDDVRNVIDSIMGIIDEFEDSEEEGSGSGAELPEEPSCASQVKMIVYAVRAGLSEIYALLQLSFGITLAAYP